MTSWNDERPPQNKVLLPEGWRTFEVNYCEKTVSKSGNPMFKVSLKDQQTGTFVDVFAISVPGKRWILKQLLDAAGVEKKDDDDHDYSADLIDSKIGGLVVHEPNDYINRDGIEVKSTQHRVQDFKPFNTINPDGVTKPEDISWGE